MGSEQPEYLVRIGWGDDRLWIGPYHDLDSFIRVCDQRDQGLTIRKHIIQQAKLITKLTIETR